GAGAQSPRSERGGGTPSANRCRHVFRNGGRPGADHGEHWCGVSSARGHHRRGTGKGGCLPSRGQEGGSQPGGHGAVRGLIHLKLAVGGKTTLLKCLVCPLSSRAICS